MSLQVPVRQPASRPTTFTGNRRAPVEDGDQSSITSSISSEFVSRPRTNGVQVPSASRIPARTLVHEFSANSPLPFSTTSRGSSRNTNPSVAFSPIPPFTIQPAASSLPSPISPRDPTFPNSFLSTGRAADSTLLTPNYSNGSYIPRSTSSYLPSSASGQQSYSRSDNKAYDVSASPLLAPSSDLTVSRSYPSILSKKDRSIMDSNLATQQPSTADHIRALGETQQLSESLERAQTELQAMSIQNRALTQRNAMLEDALNRQKRKVEKYKQSKAEMDALLAELDQLRATQDLGNSDGTLRSQLLLIIERERRLADELAAKDGELENLRAAHRLLQAQLDVLKKQRTDSISSDFKIRIENATHKRGGEGSYSSIASPRDDARSDAGPDSRPFAFGTLEGRVPPATQSVWTETESILLRDSFTEPMLITSHDVFTETQPPVVFDISTETDKPSVGVDAFTETDASSSSAATVSANATESDDPTVAAKRRSLTSIVPPLFNNSGSPSMRVRTHSRHTSTSPSGGSSLSPRHFALPLDRQVMPLSARSGSPSFVPQFHQQAHIYSVPTSPSHIASIEYQNRQGAMLSPGHAHSRSPSSPPPIAYNGRSQSSRQLRPDRRSGSLGNAMPGPRDDSSVSVTPLPLQSHEITMTDHTIGGGAGAGGPNLTDTITSNMREIQAGQIEEQDLKAEIHTEQKLTHIKSLSGQSIVLEEQQEPGGAYLTAEVVSVSSDAEPQQTVVEATEQEAKEEEDPTRLTIVQCRRLLAIIRNALPEPQYSAIVTEISDLPDAVWGQEIEVQTTRDGIAFEMETQTEVKQSTEMDAQTDTKESTETDAQTDTQDSTEMDVQTDSAPLVESSAQSDIALNTNEALLKERSTSVDSSINQLNRSEILTQTDAKELEDSGDRWMSAADLEAAYASALAAEEQKRLEETKKQDGDSQTTEEPGREEQSVQTDWCLDPTREYDIYDPQSGAISEDEDGGPVDAGSLDVSRRSGGGGGGGGRSDSDYGGSDHGEVLITDTDAPLNSLGSSTEESAVRPSVSALSVPESQATELFTAFEEIKSHLQSQSLSISQLSGVLQAFAARTEQLERMIERDQARQERAMQRARSGSEEPASPPATQEDVAAARQAILADVTRMAQTCCSVLSRLEQHDDTVDAQLNRLQDTLSQLPRTFEGAFSPVETEMKRISTDVVSRRLFMEAQLAEIRRVLSEISPAVVTEVRNELVPLIRQCLGVIPEDMMVIFQPMLDALRLSNHTLTAVIDESKSLDTLLAATVRSDTPVAYTLSLPRPAPDFKASPVRSECSEVGREVAVPTLRRRHAPTRDSGTQCAPIDPPFELSAPSLIILTILMILLLAMVLAPEPWEFHQRFYT